MGKSRMYKRNKIQVGRNLWYVHNGEWWYLPNGEVEVTLINPKTGKFRKTLVSKIERAAEEGKCKIIT